MEAQIIRKDTSFMYNNLKFNDNCIKLNYESLEKNNIKILKYATKTCDFFSLITHLKKPYSKRPPLCEHDELLLEIKPYLLNQIIGIRKWSNNGVGNNHMVMNIYKCCKETRLFLTNTNDYFNPRKCNLPEDICFYRKRAVWLATVSHERLAFIYSFNEEDRSFLEKLGCSYGFEPFIEHYHLPVVKNNM